MQASSSTPNPGTMCGLCFLGESIVMSKQEKVRLRQELQSSFPCNNNVNNVPFIKKKTPQSRITRGCPPSLAPGFLLSWC